MGRMALVSGFHAFLHTPCGWAPLSLCVPAGVVSVPGLFHNGPTLTGSAPGQWLFSTWVPDGPLRLESLGGSRRAVWQQGLTETHASNG